jgi:hypothetical protein
MMAVGGVGFLGSRHGLPILLKPLMGGVLLGVALAALLGEIALTLSSHWSGASDILGRITTGSFGTHAFWGDWRQVFAHFRSPR